MELDKIRGLDIYLLDQLMKGRITHDQRILDAGCGSGRNIVPLIEDGYNAYGFDPQEKNIAEIQRKLVNHKHRFKVAKIEDFDEENEYNVVICNAVLHFANDHNQFENQFQCLVNCLQPKGLLFIRMASNIGLENQFKMKSNGLSLLPDGTNRYLITRDKIDALISKYNLALLEPVKTINVDGLRCMTTLVFTVS